MKAKITITNLIRVENIPNKVIEQLSHILTLDNPDYVKKVQMGFWLGKTPKTLSLFVKIPNGLIIPYGMKDTLFEMLKNIPYEVIREHSEWPVDFKQYQDLSLYDYQQEAVDKMLEKDNGILISPTGSGKTRMAMALIGKRGVKTLWVTHTLDLLRQSKQVFKNFYKGEIGEIASGKATIGDITFATVQSLNNMDLDMIRNEFELLLIDETHKATGTANQVKMFYNVITTLNCRYKYGVTATLYDKPNQISSSPLYIIGDKLHEIKKEQIKRITAKHIPIFLDTPHSDIFLNPDKTLNYNELTNYLIYNQERNNHIYNQLIKSKDNYNIILSNRIDHIDILHDMLLVEGYKVDKITGQSRPKDRENVLERFRKGEINYLISNYQLAKEGLDLPIADTLHLVMPMRDKTTIIQSKGRVERLYPNKTQAYVYDYIDIQIGALSNMYKTRRRYF